VAPYITMTRAERWRARAASFAKGSSDKARQAPHMVVQMFRSAVDAAPAVAARVKEDVTMIREMRKAKKSAQPQMEAAAE
jgi:hypothetical protein